MKLTDYQQRALAYTFKVADPALFMDMRLGKSVVYAYRARAYPKHTKNLIVCPLSAFDGWIKVLREIIQCEPVLIYGDRMQRLDTLRKNSRFYIVNWDGYRVIPEMSLVKWHSVCLDESTQIKNPRSNITKYFMRCFREAAHRWILSGTPDTENILDLICQFNFLNPYLLNINYWEFRESCCYMSDYMSFKPNSRGDMLLARAMTNTHIKTREEVNFPCVKMYENRYLTMPAELREKYNLCEREFLIENTDIDFKTLWIMQRAIWLRLMTSGIIDKKIVWMDKIIETINIIRNTKEPVIVWTTFLIEYEKVLLSLAAGRIHAEGINGSTSVNERAGILQRFNTGKVRIIVAQPECYKFGADLSRASCMIYFSQPNSLITKVQTEDRAVHLTKKCPVMIYNMIVKDSIDSDAIDAFTEKKKESARLRKIVNELLG